MPVLFDSGNLLPASTLGTVVETNSPGKTAVGDHFGKTEWNFTAGLQPIGPARFAQYGISSSNGNQVC
eukprot:5821332-Amphidinium_carterae.1